MVLTSALRSARLPVNLFGYSLYSYANLLIGSPINSRSTGADGCRCCALQLGDKPGSCQEDPKQRSIVVQITDQCPECGPNHLDIQALTWAKVRSSACDSCALVEILNPKSQNPAPIQQYRVAWRARARGSPSCDAQVAMDLAIKQKDTCVLLVLL